MVFDADSESLEWVIWMFTNWRTTEAVDKWWCRLSGHFEPSWSFGHSKKSSLLQTDEVLIAGKVEMRLESLAFYLSIHETQHMGAGLVKMKMNIPELIPLIPHILEASSSLPSTFLYPRFRELTSLHRESFWVLRLTPIENVYGKKIGRQVAFVDFDGAILLGDNSPLNLLPSIIQSLIPILTFCSILAPRAITLFCKELYWFGISKEKKCLKSGNIFLTFNNPISIFFNIQISTKHIYDNKFLVSLFPRKKTHRSMSPCCIRKVPREFRRVFHIAPPSSPAFFRRKIHAGGEVRHRRYVRENHSLQSNKRNVYLSRYICEGYYVLISEEYRVKNSRSRKQFMWQRMRKTGIVVELLELYGL